MKNENSKEVSVLVSGPFNEPFDYVLEDKNTSFSVGQIVLVPFGKWKIVGIIIGDGTKTIPEKKVVKPTTGNEKYPISSICWKIFLKYQGGLNAQ